MQQNFELLQAVTPHILIQVTLLLTVSVPVLKFTSKVLKWLVFFDSNESIRERSTLQFVPVEERYLDTLRAVRLGGEESGHLNTLRCLTNTIGGREDVLSDGDGRMGWETDSFFDDVRQEVQIFNVDLCDRSISTLSSGSRRRHDSMSRCSTVSDSSVMIILDTPPRSQRSDASVQCVNDQPSTRIMTCPICWVDYVKIRSRPDADASRVITITSCGHVLCNNCRKTAFPRQQSQLNCPVCSKPYNDANVSQLFF